MPYKITEITSREVWDQFLDALKPHSFLHSWQWGEFQAAMGERVWRLGIWRPTEEPKNGKTEELVGVALVIKVSARRGSFLFVPHGPLMQIPLLPAVPRRMTGEEGVGEEGEATRLPPHLASPLAGEEALDHFATLVEYLKNIAVQEQVAFIRVSPLCNTADAPIFRLQGFRPAPIHMHPELAWILDVRSSEDDLLRGMRKTTRYMIRQAEKHGVEVRESAARDDVQKFYDLYRTTVDRHHFVPFSREYLKKEFEAFRATNSLSLEACPPLLAARHCRRGEGKGEVRLGMPQSLPLTPVPLPQGERETADARLFFASHKGEILSAAMIIFAHGSAFYHQGASSAQYPQLGASSALQWAAIRAAKARGCAFYNFWGIAPANEPKHPWAGLSFFKQGFGGFAEEYLHAQDLVLKPSYWINFGIETMRKLKRGL